MKKVKSSENETFFHSLNKQDKIWAKCNFLQISKHNLDKTCVFQIFINK